MTTPITFENIFFLAKSLCFRGYCGGVDPTNYPGLYSFCDRVVGYNCVIDDVVMFSDTCIKIYVLHNCSGDCGISDTIILDLTDGILCHRNNPTDDINERIVSIENELGFKESL